MELGSCDLFGPWILKFGICLGFGIWVLEFSVILCPTFTSVSKTSSP